MQRSPKINGNMLQHWLLRSFYLILLNKPNELYECAHIHHMCRTCVYIQKNRESAVICVKCNSQFESHCIQSQSRPSFGHLVWNSVDFQSMIIFTGWKVNLGNMSTVARFIYLSIDRKTTTSRNWSQILKVSLMTIKKASKYGIFLLGNWKIDEENFARAFTRVIRAPFSMFTWKWATKNQEQQDELKIAKARRRNHRSVCFSFVLANGKCRWRK